MLCGLEHGTRATTPHMHVSVEALIHAANLMIVSGTVFSVSSTISTNTRISMHAQVVDDVFVDAQRRLT